MERRSVHDMLRFDSAELRWKRAITATVALGITVIVIGAVGPVGMAAGLAALFVVAAGPSDADRIDGWSVAFVAAGVVVTLIVGSVSGSSVAASIVVALLAAATTFAVGWGRRFAEMGVFLLLWGVVTLTIEQTPEGVRALAAWFGVGGLIAIVAAWGAGRVSGASPDQATEPSNAAPTTSAPSISTALTVFAVLRGIGAGACVYLGYQWFPDHLAWATLAFVIVLRPPEHDAVVVGLGRMLGTIAGVLVGMLVAEIIGENVVAQVIAFVVAGFLVAAFNKVNYALFTLFVTTLLLVAEQILRDGVVTVAWERFVATLVGVGIAFVIVLVLVGLARNSQPAAAHAGGPA